jgi:hypothetical protein
VDDIISLPSLGRVKLSLSNNIVLKINTMETTTIMPPKQNKEPDSQSKKSLKPYIIKRINVDEILDESGEVNESTIVKIKADDGIIWNLSVGAAYKLERDLRDLLGL